MLIDIVEVRVVDDHRLYLRFADGVEGEVDLSGLIRWEGVFAPLRILAASPRSASTPSSGRSSGRTAQTWTPMCWYAAVTGHPVDLASPTVRP